MIDSKLLTDEQFERLFERVVRYNLDDMIASAPPKEEMEKKYTFSERHNARMEKLFRQVRAGDRLRTVFRWSKRTVAYAAAVLAVFFVMLYTFSPDVRAAINNVIIRWYEQFVSFRGAEPTETSEVGYDPSRWRPAYLPAGFEETRVTELYSQTTSIFENYDGCRISFIVMLAYGTISVNNEYVIHSTITMNGTEYYLFESVNERISNSIVWHKNGYGFSMTADFSVPISELLLIAESITAEP